MVVFVHTATAVLSQERTHSNGGAQAGTDTRQRRCSVSNGHTATAVRPWGKHRRVAS